MEILSQFLIAACSATTFVPQTKLAINGMHFYINDRLTYADYKREAHGRLMNVRMVNAVFDDENPATCPSDFNPDTNTDRFIELMNDYKAKGILAFTINLQGGMPGYEGAINSAFRSDGGLKPNYMDRVRRVIEAADARGLIIILGFFYQRQDGILQDVNAVRQATVNATTWICDQGYTNVIVEIANEYRHPGFDHQIITDEDGEVELMNLVRQTAPNLLVSTSGMGDAKFHSSLANAADFILIHGNTSDPDEYEGKVNALKHYNKPIVFNEDWCFSDDTRRIGDAVEKLTNAFEAGASWGIMNQIRNQQYPFIFEIGKPNEGENAKLDFQAYERMAKLVGIE